MTGYLNQRFGDYRLVRLLGSGGFAEVYEAEHLHLPGTKAAIKLLKERFTAQQIEELRKEAILVNALNHPHIVQLRTFSIERNIPYLVMSYASGGSLDKRHPSGTRLTLPEILSYVRPVAQALQYAHQRHIVHRDLKPANLLLTEDERVQVTDFGIAIVADSSTNRTIQEIAGTLRYMAPEQLQGQAGPASDQYALATIVYQWLCGTVPFDGNGNLQVILQQQMNEQPPPLRQRVPGLFPNVEYVVMKALSKDPRERFASIQEFAEALDEACEPPLVIAPRQRLGDYQLVTKLGEGRFAEVYGAEHMYLGTRAAIKLLKGTFTPTQIGELRKEILLVITLNHPHIVRLYTFSVEHNIPYLVMSYASGGSLDKRHPRGTRLTFPEILEYVRQIASALQYAHDQNITHRDLKPENMLLTEDGRVQVADFGIVAMAEATQSDSGSRENDDNDKQKNDAEAYKPSEQEAINEDDHSQESHHSQTGKEIVGSWVYMAPEQFEGRAGPASDQYALGIMVYQWLCGVAPFTVNNMFALAYQHMNELPPSLRQKVPTLSPAIERVVMKALSKKPQDRFPSVQAFAQALEEAASDQQPKLQRFGNYDLLRRINPGMTGDVWLAREHNTSEREVVVKIIYPYLKDDTLTRQCFLREVEVSGYLKNEHIVPLIESGEEQSRLFLVWPYIKEGSFNAKLKNAPLALPEIRQIFTALLEAVSHLHKRGVVHGNLSPYSILLDKTEDGKGVYVRLTNLYMASIRGSSISPLPEMSTHADAAAAPERRNGIIEPSGDIYSLGVLLFQMLTGKFPYQDRTYPLIEELEPLISVAMRCMEYLPENRYNDVDGLLGVFNSTCNYVQKSEQPTAPLEPIESSEGVPTEQTQTSQEATAEEWFQRGFALNEQKSYEEAIHAFDQVIRLKPDFTNAYYNKGVALNELKRYDEAIHAFDQAIRLNPNLTNAYYNKGFALNELKRYEEAIHAFDQVIRLNPNSVRGPYNKGFALLNLQLYEEAIHAFDQVIRLNPNLTNAYMNKGIALGNLQRYEDAILAFDKVIQLNPNSTNAYTNKGTALNKLKRFAEAIVVFDQALRFNPNDADTHNNRNWALTNLKWYEKPTLTYGISVDVSPKELPIGGEVEVVLSLSLGPMDDDNAYLLEVPQNEMSGLELNALLTAPHFHINGDNASSLPLDLVTAQDMDTSSIRSQTARFSLTALRSGSVTLQLDLYAGDVSKTSLEYTIQVAKIDQADSFSIHDLTRPRPVRHPDLILQVRNDADTENAIDIFHYHLTSPRTIMHMPEQGLEYRSTEFPVGWLERVYALLCHTLESTEGAQTADRRTRLASLGQYLFRSLLPRELQDILRGLVGIGHTLLILSDQDAAFPWTLLHDGDAFLGDHFSIGRWLRELHDTRPYEFPVGTVSVAYYEGINRPELWAEILTPPGAPEAVPLPGGLLNISTTETIRGLHLLRTGKSSRATDLRDAPAQRTGESSIEQQAQIAKFSLRNNHPLVTLGYLHAGLSEITALEQSWSSTFIRAGCSAFIGPLWAVEPTVEATFVSTFYTRLWAGDTLGDAFGAARELTRMLVPNSIDYLAYVLFGDPMAQPYRPVEGDGYATVEPVGREMEDPVSPGTNARFRVSLRRRPPIWHEGRVIEVTQSLNFEHLKVYVVTFGLQVTPATPITLMRASTGDYFGWFSLTVPKESKHAVSVVQVHFVDEPDLDEAGDDEFDEAEPIHSLRFTLPITGGDDNGR